MSQIKIEVQGIDRVMSSLRGVPSKVANPALKRGTKRAGTAAKTFGAKQIGQVYNVKAARIKQDISLLQSSPTELTVKFAGGVISLANFRPRQLKAGLKVTVKRGEPRVIRGAFMVRSGRMAANKFGGLPAMRGTYRTGLNAKARNPIQALSTASIGTMASNEKVLIPTAERAGEVFVSTVEHEIEYRMAQL